MTAELAVQASAAAVSVPTMQLAPRTAYTELSKLQSRSYPEWLRLQTRLACLPASVVYNSITSALR
jgi:hypothetical protein